MSFAETQSTKTHKQQNWGNYNKRHDEEEEIKHQREQVFSAIAEQKPQSEFIPLWRKECTIKTGIELSKH